MKIKIKDLNPNPFNKNNWIVDKIQLGKIKSNIKDLGLMGSIPIVKIKNKWYIIYGHHRVVALKEEFGKDFEIECTEHKYNDEQIFRGYIIENLTQKTDDFKWSTKQLKDIDTNLKENKDWLSGLYIYKSPRIQKLQPNMSENIGHGQIYQWIHNVKTQEEYEYYKKNKRVQEQVISFATIQQYLDIENKLDESLKLEINKQHIADAEERDKTIGFTQGLMLTKFEDKEEQKDLANAMKSSTEHRVREQDKLLTKYKKAPLEIKEQVRKGEIDLTDIPILIKIERSKAPEDTITDIFLDIETSLHSVSRKMKNAQQLISKLNDTQNKNIQRTIQIIFQKTIVPFLDELYKTKGKIIFQIK